MTSVRTWAAAAALLLVAGLGLAACDNESDPVAPPDSTITVSANPQTVIVADSCIALEPGINCGTKGTCTTQIIATVYSKNGTRLPDQAVEFSTSSGDLDPFAGTPITTDNQGQARSCLTTTTTATVTARSGGITKDTQIQTAPGDLRQIVLLVDSDLGEPDNLDSCSEEFTLSALVEKTDGTPVPNFRVIFDEVSNSTVTGVFTPGGSQGTASTGTDGTATVSWVPGSSCVTKCSSTGADPNNPGICTLGFFASDSGGGFRSTTVIVNDNVD